MSQNGRNQDREESQNVKSGNLRKDHKSAEQRTQKWQTWNVEVLIAEHWGPKPGNKTRWSAKAQKAEAQKREGGSAEAVNVEAGSVEHESG